MERSRLGGRALVAGVLAMLVSLAIALASPLPAAAATVLPTGFTDTEWVSGLNRPYQMEFAPDGRLFVSQQGGKLRVIKNGALLSTPFVTVPVDATGDRGLIGIAFDPNFSSNRFVYVYYTSPTPVSHNRVSRFTANGDVAVAGSEQVLIELPDLGTSTLHNGGSIHFGADGKLYISVGDNVQGAGRAVDDEFARQGASAECRRVHPVRQSVLLHGYRQLAGDLGAGHAQPVHIRNSTDNRTNLPRRRRRQDVGRDRRGRGRSQLRLADDRGTDH